MGDDAMLTAHSGWALTAGPISVLPGLAHYRD